MPASLRPLLSTAFAAACISLAVAAPAQQVTTPMARPDEAAHVSSTRQADAEQFLALSRRSLATCGSPSPALQQQYAAAMADYTQGKYPLVIAASNTLIDACTAAQLAYQAQAAAAPAPSTTPMVPAGDESIVTPGPDPALQQTPR